MTALGSRGTGQAGRPTWWASLVVRTAALPLPAEHRWRYRQEFLAELYGMTPSRAAAPRHWGPLARLDSLDGLDRAGTAHPRGGHDDQALPVSHRPPPLAAAAQPRRRLVPRMHRLRTTTVRPWRRRRHRSGHTMTTPWRCRIGTPPLAPAAQPRRRLNGECRRCGTQRDEDMLSSPPSSRLC